MDIKSIFQKNTIITFLIIGNLSFFLVKINSNLETINLNPSIGNSTYNTEPSDPDSDDDDLNDGDEVLIYFTDPNNSDTDGNGWNDKQEIIRGLDPNDASSNPTYSVNPDQHNFNAIMYVFIPLAVIIIIYGIRRYLSHKRKKIKEMKLYSKDRLANLIQRTNQLNLNFAKMILRIPKKKIKTLIYDLAGEGKILGEFQGDTFIIFSDIDKFIEILNSAFESWGKKEKVGEGKIENY
jgi:hypothetical protein